MQQNSDICEQQ